MKKRFSSVDVYSLVSWKERISILGWFLNSASKKESNTWVLLCSRNKGSGIWAALLGRRVTGIRCGWGWEEPACDRAGAEELLIEEGDSERETREIWLEVRGTSPRGPCGGSTSGCSRRGR